MQSNLTYYITLLLQHADIDITNDMRMEIASIQGDIDERFAKLEKSIKALQDALPANKLTVKQLEILNALSNGCSIVSFGDRFSLTAGMFEVGNIDTDDLQALIDSGHIDPKKEITRKGIEALGVK